MHSYLGVEVLLDSLFDNRALYFLKKKKKKSTNQESKERISINGCGMTRELQMSDARDSDRPARVL